MSKKEEQNKTNYILATEPKRVEKGRESGDIIVCKVSIDGKEVEVDVTDICHAFYKANIGNTKSNAYLQAVFEINQKGGKLYDLNAKHAAFQLNIEELHKMTNEELLKCPKDWFVSLADLLVRVGDIYKKLEKNEESDKNEAAAESVEVAK